MKELLAGDRKNGYSEILVDKMFRFGFKQFRARAQ
jgi:hypothetical protein